jgi:peptide/nickel transport system ATP-binding protein
VTGPMSSLLEVDDLAVSFDIRGGRLTAVDGVSLSIRPGETLGVVGESGSGKSVMAYSLVGLLADNGRIDRGQIRFDGRDLRSGPNEMARARGAGIAFIFQNPRAALNPIRTVGDQVRDALEASRRSSRRDTTRRALELLEQVRIDRAKDRFHAFPHELSGGMCQRILIAMALAAEPKLLIADEPTTGLDVTTQKIIMDTLYELGASNGLATLLITHDVGLAARYCRRIAVMCDGKVVETGSTAEVLERSRVPYTQRLVAATPRTGRKLIDLLPPCERGPFAARVSERGDGPAVTEGSGLLLNVQGLSKSFHSSRAVGTMARAFRRLFGRGGGADAGGRPSTETYAVRDLSLTLKRGARLGIVGESGSGKTTSSRMIARLLDQTEGSIEFDGADIGAVPSAAFNRSTMRRRIQVVFQNPLGSLNPRFTAYQAILNPLRRAEPSMSREMQRSRVVDAARQAGFDPMLLSRFPHQLSGGQQARVGIARALVVKPDLLILDEPTSALDVSIQALVLNQLDLLQRELNLTYILVSHDLNVIRLMCDSVLVMRFGRVVESGDVETIFQSPSHPYTKELINAVPHLPAQIVENAL